jgi:hypothetical protein
MPKTKLLEEIKTQILCLTFFFRILCHLWDNVEEYGKARQVIDDNMLGRMRCAFCVIKAAGSLS